MPCVNGCTGLEGAGAAVLRRELDLDDVVAALVDGWCPTDAGTACRAGGLLVVPVDREPSGIEALPVAGLPVVVLPGRTEQVHAELRRCGHQQLGVQVTGVDEVQARQ